jgi:hypothetical protein
MPLSPYKSAVSRQSKLLDDHNQSIVPKNLLASQDTKISTLASSGGMIKSNDIGVMPSARVYLHGHKMGLRNIQIQCYGQTGFQSPSIKLTALPSWPHVEDTNICVMLPTSGDKSVKIMINKASKDRYVIGAEPDSHLPAMIHRDPRAIKRSYELGPGNTSERRHPPLPPGLLPLGESANAKGKKQKQIVDSI